ncbi:hypothetical protein [Methylobacterium sp. JK268]
MRRRHLLAVAALTGAFLPGSGGARAGAGPPVTVRTASDLAKPYPPGTRLVVPKGTVIEGPVVMAAAGTAERPVTVTGGGRITGGPALYTDALTVGSHTVVDGITISDTNRYGVSAPKGTVGVTVRGVEIARVGIGIGLMGSRGRVTGSFIHDLSMVKVTPRSVSPDDDYGANGILLSGDGHEIDHNRFVANAAPSDDYGEDGGCIELFGAVSAARIHHNWCEDSVGFMEAGGARGDAIQDVDIAFNVALNLHDKPFFNPHNGGGAYAATFRSVRLRRNTIVATAAGPKAMGVFYLDADPAPDAFRVEDNVVALNAGDSVFKRPGGYYSGNVYWLRDKATHLFNNWSMTLGPGDAFADPGFVDPDRKNFRLRAGSPAAGKGAY